MRPPIRRPPVLLVAPWARAELLLFYTHHGGCSQVLPEMDDQPFGRSRISRSRISVGVTRTSGHHDSSESSPAARDAPMPRGIPLRRSPRRTISGAKPPPLPAL